MPPIKIRRAAAAATLTAASLTLPAAAQAIDYPDTPTVDHVDTYHGTEVADPYRWLEDDVRTNPDVAQWVREQNTVTFGYLRNLPQRPAIRQRLEELWDYERFSAPSKVADFYVYSRNDGLQNHSVLERVDSLDAEPEVLLDPNTWSDDGTVSLQGLSFSEDGRYMAYAKSVAGSDWDQWFVRDLRTGEDLADRIEWTKWGGVSWTHDNRGFFYTRFPEPAEGEQFQAENKNAAIYYHRLGTPQSDDTLVWNDPDNPDHSLWSSVTDDGRYLVIGVSAPAEHGNRLMIRDLSDPYARPLTIVDSFDDRWNIFANDGDTFYAWTDRDAPNGRVVRFRLSGGLESAETVLEERENEPLRSVQHVGNMFIAGYYRDVINRYEMFTMEGEPVRVVEAPSLGVISGFGGEPDHTETFFTFRSPTTPPSIYRYDLITGESELFRQPEVAFDPSEYTTHRVFYRSADGTRVPMFISHRKGLALDGSNPTLLYGYGGFNIPMTPGFSAANLAWMDMGGVYAEPSIRGGGEYGKSWHKAGSRLEKQNTFDDFIAAAEYLIDKGYTSPEHIAIRGGSNGGLLVGAVMTQRPDLFAAALPAVGVMDMLRFHRFTVGRFWVDDYGSADDPDQFEVLLGYSPSHNLEPGTAYPATLVTTGDTDDRVVPGHSFKFAARLQAAHEGEAPVLIRIQESAGHGAGTPTSVLLDTIADVWAFAAEHTGLDPSTPEN